MKAIYFVIILLAASVGAATDAYALKLHFGSSGNTHVQQQSNSSNTSIIVQTPYGGDVAKTYQNGNGNVAIIIQAGSGQTASIKQ